MTAFGHAAVSHGIVLRLLVFLGRNIGERALGD
jgi:hypothetical protein